MDAAGLILLMSATAGGHQKQLLSLYDHLGDLLSNSLQTPTKQKIFNATLNKYCVHLCQQAEAKHPKILADHLLFIAENAFLQEIAQPESKSLAHAKKVAQALILAQTQTPPHFLKKISNDKFLWVSSGLSIALITGFLIWSKFEKNPNTPTQASNLHNEQVDLSIARNAQSSLTAQEASAMYAKFEMMRNGTCRYIEAIQIPDQDKAIYLESVVGGKLPTNLKDLATANAYLEKINCNYTPMLMQKSK